MGADRSPTTSGIRLRFVFTTPRPDGPEPMEDRPLQAELESQRQRIDVDHLDVTVRELVRMSVDGELRRAPVYQRKFRWSEELESKLIESLLLGLPVPSVFVATNRDGTWEVVDGLQRLSTLLHFVSDDPDTLKSIDKGHPLLLHGLDKLLEFDGLGYVQLPAPIQLAFMKRTIRVTALSDKSDLEARFDMFERLNTGGVALTPQEVRACIYRGEFNDLLRDLGEYKPFVTLVKLQRSQQNDGTREELALKFFAYLHDQRSFDGRVANFLNQYMHRAAAGDFDVEAGRALFLRTVDALVDLSAGQPILRQGLRTTPLNQLEAIMVAAGRLLLGGEDRLSPPAGWLEDTELVSASTGGTNTRSMLKRRLDRAELLLSGRS